MKLLAFYCHIFLRYLTVPSDLLGKKKGGGVASHVQYVYVYV